MRPALSPGELLSGLATLTKLAKQQRRVSELPPRDVEALYKMLKAMRWYADHDVHYSGMLLDQALARIDRAVDAGDIGKLSTADLRVVGDWLPTIKTTQRGAA